MKKKQKQALEPKIQLHIKEEERNLFRDEHKRRYRMDHRSMNMCVLAVLTVIVFVAVLFLPNGMDSNNLHISIAWWGDILQRNITDFTRLISGENAEYMDILVCRFTVIALVGATLASSGAVYQGSLKNGLASPTTLGVQTGAVLGGTIYVLFLMPELEGIVQTSDLSERLDALSVFHRYEQSLFMIAGSLLAVAFVVTVARIAGRGKVSGLALILTGMMFSGTAGGIIGLVNYKLMLTETYGTKTYVLRYLMMGTFSNILTFEHLLLVGIPVTTGLIVVMLLRSRLNLLVFGEDEARVMGLRVDMTRNILVGTVTVMTAVVISFCGMIGFIGFIVPHMARRLTGPDFRWLLPASAMTGAIAMMVIYYVATVVNYSDNINFMTSLIGGTAFLIVMIRSRRRSNADWA